MVKDEVWWRGEHVSGGAAVHLRPRCGRAIFFFRGKKKIFFWWKRGLRATAARSFPATSFVAGLRSLRAVTTTEVDGPHPL